MTVEQASGLDGVHVVDTHLFGTPGVMSAYLVESDAGVAVVDPGAATGVEHVRDAVASLGYAPVEVTHVVPTHVHLDHAGGAGALAGAFPDATVAVHERGARYLTDPERLERLVASARDALGPVADAYGEAEPVPADRCRELADGDVVDLGGRTLEAVDAPGHAPHQAALVDDATGAVFAGDAAGMWLFGECYPTTPPPDFDLDASLATVDRLAARDPSAVCYGHFGVREDAAAALATVRELLPDWVAAVQDVAAAHDDPDAMVQALDARWQSPTVERDLAGVLRTL
jgi:glyoxylase-like metal-dependent hydrolase (beta-lactamase superfamily II)